MSLTVDALNQDELDFLLYATLSEKVANKDETLGLSRTKFPTLNLLQRNKSRNPGNPVRGGYRWNVKGLRGQKIQWWDGMDILPFEERFTGNAMRFYVGMGHLGDTLRYDLLQRLGIRIDYGRGIREGVANRSQVETVVNYLRENADDIKYNAQRELALTVMRSNADQPKCFTGLLGLMPIVNPTGGTIGGMSRSNPQFQHLVSTAWTSDNFISNFMAFYKSLARMSNGHEPDIISVGDNIYDLLDNIFSGAASGSGAPANTVAGKFDYARAKDAAAALGEKYNIALPQDCFVYQGKLIINDPVYQALAAEDPSVGWQGIGFALTSEYQFLVPVMEFGDTKVVHPMPFNQRVQHTSYHGEYVLANICPNSSGVFTTNYGGLGMQIGQN